MPPRNQSEGFGNRNQHLGHFWTDLSSDCKDIYNEDIFYKLGNLACGRPLPDEAGSATLTGEEITKYLPIFKENINLDRVAKDLGKGKFGPDLPTKNQNKGIKEIDRIDNDVSCCLSFYSFLLQ